MKYGYTCPRCGPFDIEGIAADAIQCRCGASSKRRYQFSVDKASLKSFARWDPVVGRYVENQGQFNSALAEAQERESKLLGMDCKLATCDSRDSEALGELHGWGSDKREADLEATKRHEYDKANT